MKEIVKNVLNETIEYKKLRQAYVYFSNYIGTLEEVVKGNNIYLHESDDEYAKLWIRQSLECVVDWKFWEEFSELFLLERHEIQIVISKCIENTYQLNNIRTYRYPPPLLLEIP